MQSEPGEHIMPELKRIIATVQIWWKLTASSSLPSNCLLDGPQCTCGRYCGDRSDGGGKVPLPASNPNNYPHSFSSQHNNTTLCITFKLHMSIQHTAVVLYSPSGLAWPTCHMRDTCVRLDRVYGMCSKSIFATMILLLIFSLSFFIFYIFTYVAPSMYLCWLSLPNISCRLIFAVTV